MLKGTFLGARYLGPIAGESGPVELACKQVRVP